MNTWKFKTGIVAVFVLGAVVGAVGTGIAIRYRASEFAFATPEQVVEHIMSRLRHELNLSAAQEKEIAPIVWDGFMKMRTLRSSLTPQVETLTAATALRIKQYLNAEQQVRLDDYDAKILDHWRRFAAPLGPPPAATPPGGAAK